MDVFTLNYNENNLDYKLKRIQETIEQNNIEECSLVFHAKKEILQYSKIKDFIELTESSLSKTNISFKLVLEDSAIEQEALEILKKYEASVSVEFNEHNEAMENINKLINAGIDCDIIIVFNEKLMGKEDKLAEWVMQNNFDITIVPENAQDDNYSSFVIGVYKLLQKKQYFKIINPISSYLVKEVSLRNKGNLKKERKEDNLYCFKTEENKYTNIYTIDDAYNDKDLLRYRTNNNCNYFIPKGLKKQVDRMYSFLQREGVQDLKDNMQKRQMKLQGLQAQPEDKNYDILMVFAYRQGYSTTSPMGLYLLEVYVEQFGYNAKVLDVSAQGLQDLFESEIYAGKTSIVGFYCSYDNQYLVRNSIKQLKQKSNVITFVGGPQAVALNEDFLRETGCDVITEGEGEDALKELLDYYVNKKGDLKDIKNIKFIDENNQYHKNELREPIRDLDSLPFPKLKYGANGKTKQSYLGYIITGRGCPFRCAFCYEGANSKVVRYRSIENVFKEVNYIIKENPKVKYIQIYDDTFTLDVKRVKAFCEEMKKVREYHNLYWFCEAHVNNLYKNPDLVSEMVSAGLFSIQIGIESGSQKVLNAYNKNTTPEMICEVVNRCRESGLNELEGNIIVGGAWENKETIEEDIALSKKLIRAGIGIIELLPLYFAPYPETPMTNCPEKYGIEIIEDQVKKTMSSMANVVIRTKELSREEIIAAKKRIEDVIVDEYRKVTLELDKEIIFRKFLNEDKSIKTQSMWGRQIYKYEHMRNYVKMATGKNYRFGDTNGFEKWYPIRTFELLEYVDNSLFINGLTFENIQMKLLEYSTGRYTIEQIAKIIGISSEAVFEACKELEKRCFIYYSRI